MKLAIAATPILSLLIMGASSNSVSAWDSGGGGEGAYSNAFYAGEQDAAYDHDNGYAYNPIGQCLPCHSDGYWSNFHEGYDHQWNTYQSQGSSINNNYVSTSQYSNQQQNPLQQLGHVVCGLVNCNGGPGYEP